MAAKVNIPFFFLIVSDEHCIITIVNSICFLFGVKISYHLATLQKICFWRRNFFFFQLISMGISGTLS